MTLITLRVLDGADRGRVFEDIPTPITIGREEGATVQLNDERVSRYHIKIQEDENKLVATDLESTNGSKVNGEDFQLRVLRYGDVIHIGRTLLLVGTREQIAARLTEFREQGPQARTLDADELIERIESASLDFELNWHEDPELKHVLFGSIPPELPERLSPGQAAQLTEMLEFVHHRLRELIDSVKPKTSGERVTLDLEAWQQVVDLQSHLAEYLRKIAEPHAGEG